MVVILADKTHGHWLEMRHLPLFVCKTKNPLFQKLLQNFSSKLTTVIIVNCVRMQSLRATVI